MKQAPGLSWFKLVSQPDQAEKFSKPIWNQ